MGRTTPAAPIWSPDRMPPQDGKTIVVTGGNSGIGYAAARAFATAGAQVVIGARSVKRGREASARIMADTQSDSVEVLELDLANLTSVHRFAEELPTATPRIDVLCNNAGVMAVAYPKRQTTSDDFELHVGVNHLGHFALTGLLFERLTASSDARVVTQSSRAHTGKFSFDPLNLDLTGSFRSAYGISKLANILFAQELARRTGGHGVTSVACHPGIAKSGIVAGGAAATGTKAPWWLRLAYAPAPSPEEGALSLLYAATGEDIANSDFVGPSGFMGSRGLPHKTRPSERALDLDLAHDLWEESERLTGVQFPVGTSQRDDVA